MTGCRIGKIKMKNGGAEIYAHPCCNDSTLTVTLSDWGEVVFRQFDDKEPITRRDALYMLRACEDKILRGNVK